MVIKIILIVLFVFALGVITLLKSKTDLISNIETNISNAESKDLTGAEKMALVVDTVYVAIIPIAKLYFTKSRIENIAQLVYDKMKEFYLARNNKK